MEIDVRFQERMRGIVMARVSPDEKRVFVAAARKRGMTLSEFLRESAADAIGRAA
jgi:uncharacterized protein (DUF1778 family)